MSLEKISKYLLLGLFGVSILIFLLFLFVGFNTPYEQDPSMNAPTLTGVFVAWAIILTVVAFIAMIWAYVSYIRQHGVERGLFFTWGLPIVTLAIGLIFGLMHKNEDFIYNMNDHATSSQIMISETALISVLILGIVAVVAIIWSLVKGGGSK